MLIVILDFPRIPLIAHIIGYRNSNKQTSGFSFHTIIFSILELIKFVVGAPFLILFEIVLSKTGNTNKGVKKE
jgi:hypothetical protein